VRAICVAPGLRRHGWGARLLAFAEERIFREAPNVFLCVSSFNLDAQRFYARLGYEPVGELRDYLVAGLGEILMRKTRGPIRGYAAR
jgi:ribosomal protein S18 acetylase RimI-like enzyme